MLRECIRGLGDIVVAADEVRIHFPGSRQYGSVGEIENDIPAETDAADIVKVVGTTEAIAKAKESLQVRSIILHRS